MARSERVVIIPAFNEAGTITRVVKSLEPYAQVIVVNDASSDATAVLARSAGAHVVDHPQNRGYTAALNSGFQAAREKGYRYALTFDADGQHEPSLVEKFFKPLEEGQADLVIGIRPEKARFSESLMGLYAWARYSVKDPLCGMKAYKMDLYQTHGSFDTLDSIGTELCLASLKRGAKAIQIPVPIHARVGTQPRFGNILRANYRILRALVRVAIYV